MTCYTNTSSTGILCICSTSSHLLNIEFWHRFFVEFQCVFLTVFSIIFHDFLFLWFECYFCFFISSSCLVFLAFPFLCGRLYLLYLWSLLFLLFSIVLFFKEFSTSSEKGLRKLEFVLILIKKWLLVYPCWFSFNGKYHSLKSWHM